MDWVLAIEGDRLFQCGIVWGKKDFSGHHCMSGVCGIEPRGCLRFVIVVFPDHTHLLFLSTM